VQVGRHSGGGALQRVAAMEVDGRLDAGAARQGFDGGSSAGEFYAALAAHWKRHYSGWTAWLLSPEMKLGGLMRMKESRRVPMWNGAIECRLYRFDIVAGAGPGARAREQSGHAAPS